VDDRLRRRRALLRRSARGLVVVLALDTAVTATSRAEPATINRKTIPARIRNRERVPPTRRFSRRRRSLWAPANAPGGRCSR
jgi:hypothetical protein